MFLLKLWIAGFLKFLLQANLGLDICCTKLQTKKNDINTIEGHFTVIYHAQHTPKASNCFQNGLLTCQIAWGFQGDTLMEVDMEPASAGPP